MKKIYASALLTSLLVSSGVAMAAINPNYSNVLAIHMNEMDLLTSQPITANYSICTFNGGCSASSSITFAPADKTKTLPAPPSSSWIVITSLQTADNTVVWGPYNTNSNCAMEIPGDSITFSLNQDNSITCSKGQG